MQNPKLRQIRNLKSIEKPVTSLPGVGEKVSQTLKKIEIETIGDLLFYLPRKHVDFTKWFKASQLGSGQKGPVLCEVLNVGSRRTLRGQSIINAVVYDGSNSFEAVWFGQGYLRRILKTGQRIVIFGPVQTVNGRTQMRVEQFEFLAEGKEAIHLKGIVPFYPLKEKVYIKNLRNNIKKAVDLYSDLPDPLPSWIRVKRSLLDRGSSIREIHFPSGWEGLERSKERLIYEELFSIELALALKKNSVRESVGFSHDLTNGLIKEFERNLPFAFTQEQCRAIKDIGRDMSSEVPMNRLLQGDVGSGKTVVALHSMMVAVQNGYQAAMLAPTEVLAGQHFKVISHFLDDLPVKLSLVTSSLNVKERKETLSSLRNGEIDIAVGTHALIEEGVKFSNLSMVVIDEQHKFGVLQRDKLRKKGGVPDTLVMTATPIPRTISMTLYGDLDVSVIKGTPGEKRLVRTVLLSPLDAEKAYERVRGEVAQGRQAYIVCPLVTESELFEAKAAEEEFEKLQKLIFPDISMGLLHGRMSSEDKEKAIGLFREGRTSILVCTTVIEVGVDVPNATIMVIEGAERFGLAQLHQLRGRVGRGKSPSECFLICDPVTEESRKRLEVIAETDDGFALAEKDLEIRGEGHLFGSRQSGYSDLKIARLVRDIEVLQIAREDAFEVVSRDAKLEKGENALLRDFVVERFGSDVEWLLRS